MGNTMKAEIKTLLHMKSVWVCVAILMVIALGYLVQGYSSAESMAESLIPVIHEAQALAADGGEVDISALEEEFMFTYKTYHPRMSVNNALGLLIAFGMLIVPVMSALFMGIEYSRNRVIKNKIAHESLVKVFLAKVLAFGGFLTALCIVYLLCSHVASVYGWSTLQGVLQEAGFDYSQVTFMGSSQLLLVFLLGVAMLLFYSLVTMLVAAVLKSSTGGVITVLAINYVALPFKYTPHNVIYKLINSTLYISPASSYEFAASADSTLSVSTAAWLFAAYFAAVVAVLLLQSRFQKNG